MYAVTGGNDIWIAIIGVVGLLGSVAIPAWLNSRKTKNAIGVPNSKGTVVEMNESQLALLETIRDGQHAIREGQAVHREHLRLIDSKLDAHAELDDRRFRVLHQHLNLPLEENQ